MTQLLPKLITLLSNSHKSWWYGKKLKGEVNGGSPLTQQNMTTWFCRWWGEMSQVIWAVSNHHLLDQIHLHFLTIRPHQDVHGGFVITESWHHMLTMQQPHYQSTRELGRKQWPLLGPAQGMAPTRSPVDSTDLKLPFLPLLLLLFTITLHQRIFLTIVYRIGQ